MPRLLAAQDQAELTFQVLKVRHGTERHYVECGPDVPVNVVHGGLEDYSLWEKQVREFGKAHRAIAYSRRHNHPHHNAPVANDSAALEADDLAALIEHLHVERTRLVGLSCGATPAGLCRTVA